MFADAIDTYNIVFYTPFVAIAIMLSLIVLIKIVNLFTTEEPKEPIPQYSQFYLDMRERIEKENIVRSRNKRINLIGGDIEDNGFILNILNNPSDRTICLVYADWLEEHKNEIFAFYLREFCYEKLVITKREYQYSDIWFSSDPWRLYFICSIDIGILKILIHGDIEIDGCKKCGTINEDLFACYNEWMCKTCQESVIKHEC